MFLITVIYLIMTSILLHIKTFSLSHIKFDFVSKYSHPCDCLSNMKYWSHKWQLVIKYPFIEVFQIWRCLKKCQNSSPKYIVFNFFLNYPNNISKFCICDINHDCIKQNCIGQPCEYGIIHIHFTMFCRVFYYIICFFIRTCKNFEPEIF